MHGPSASALPALVAAVAVAVAWLALTSCGNDATKQETRTLLLTGFGPFGGYATNPALETAKALDRQIVGRTQVVSAHLDVVYGRAGTQLRQTVEATSPDIIVCLGVAPGDAIRLETTAKNRDTCPAADNEGVIRADDPIRVDGPATLPTGLPIEAMLERLRDEGYEVRTSDDAGGYLCNHVFYRLMDEHADGRVTGFIHVPAMGGTWTLERLREAILEILEILDDGA